MNPTLSVSSLSHSYAGIGLSHTVLESINLEIAPAELLILTGPSGCGKTTLLTLIAGLRTVQSGTVRLLGTELYEASASTRLRLRSQIGMVFQTHQLIPFLTAAENIILAMDSVACATMSMSRKITRANELLRRLDLDLYANAFPSQLSGGQRQRVALARALACSPKFLIADEPTASLDPKNTEIIMRLLRSLSSDHGISILMTTHDKRLHHFADKVLNILDGRILQVASNQDRLETIGD